MYKSSSFTYSTLTSFTPTCFSPCDYSCAFLRLDSGMCSISLGSGKRSPALPPLLTVGRGVKRATEPLDILPWGSALPFPSTPQRLVIGRQLYDLQYSTQVQCSSVPMSHFLVYSVVLPYAKGLIKPSTYIPINPLNASRNSGCNSVQYPGGWFYTNIRSARVFA